MQQHLVRHFQAFTAQTPPSTVLSIRIICCMTYFFSSACFLTLGQKTKENSDKHYLRTTPPAIFFKVWYLVILGIMATSIYAAVQNTWSPELWCYIAIYNILCCVWCITFNADIPGGLVISVICQICLVITVEFLWIGLCNPSKSTWILNDTYGIVFRNLVSLAQGWLIAAAALGLGLLLVYRFGMGFNTHMVIFWISAPLVYAGLIALNVSITGRWLDTLGIFVTMGWAVLGAMISTLRNQNFAQIQKK